MAYRRPLAVAMIACLFAIFAATSAHAKHKRHHRVHPVATQAFAQCVPDNDGRQACSGQVSRIQRHATGYSDGTVIGSRPSGCPHAYCGCGLARYLGIHDPRLNLAWNWARLFPRARAAPGMAVVWHHHVALIESMTGPREAVLRDYNSGRGLSRIHVRSIAGAVVVNPSARMAGL